MALSQKDIAFIVTGAVGLIGVILLLGSIRNKKVALQASGGSLLGLGVIGVVLTAALPYFNKPAATSQSTPAVLKPIDTAAPLPPTTPKLKWQDQSQQQEQFLERVVQFDENESPSAVSGSPVEQRSAHEPKHVPAKPRRAQTYVPAVAPATATETQQLAGAFEPYSGQTLPTGGPVYFSPQYDWPVVSEMVSEREQFLSRPDTPELTRFRRVCELQEAAASLSPCTQQDGLMIPIAGPPEQVVISSPDASV